jgi:type II secretory pathway pseudopilin PulG
MYKRPALTLRPAFTLIEIMIIVAILTNVLLVAMPAFLRSRNMAQNTRYISDLRTIAGAFEMYAAENNRYPATTAASLVPSGMNIYLNGIPYTARNALGGQWYWNYTATGSPMASVGSLSPYTLDDVRMADIDMRIDNGVLATGAFRKTDATHIIFVVEQ